MDLSSSLCKRLPEGIIHFTNIGCSINQEPSSDNIGVPQAFYVRKPPRGWLPPNRLVRCVRTSCAPSAMRCPDLFQPGGRIMVISWDSVWVYETIYLRTDINRYNIYIYMKFHGIMMNFMIRIINLNGKSCFRYIINGNIVFTSW